MPRRLSSFGGYALAAAAQAGAAFIAVPLLTRLLGPEEFGHWVIFEPLAAAMAQVGLLGANHGLLKLVGEDKWPSQAAWRALMLPVLVPLALMAALAFAGCTFAGQASAAPVLAALVVLEGATLLCLAAFRANNRSGFFAAILVAKAIFWLLLLWASQSLGSPAILAAPQALAWLLVPSGVACALALTLVAWSKPAQRPQQSMASQAGFKVAVHYGLPLMLTGLLATAVAVGDRYVMLSLTDVTTIGQYVVLVKVASAISLLGMPLNMWFPAARFAHLGDADGGARFFRLAAWVVVFAMSSCAGGLWLLAPKLVAWFSPGQTADTVAVGCLLVGSVATAAAGLMNVALLQAGRTHWPLVCTAAAGALQLAALLVLVPLAGARGAAVATGAAGMLGLLMQVVLSQRWHKLPFAFGLMLVQVLMLAGVCWLIQRHVGSAVMQSVVYGLAVLLLGWASHAFESRRHARAAQELL